MSSRRTQNRRVRRPAAPGGGEPASDATGEVRGRARVFDRAFLLLAAGLLVAIFAAFSPALSAGFTNWDDDVNVTENPFLTPPTASGIAALWRQSYRNLYVPLTYTSFAGDLAVGGGKPWAFHLGNILIHCASAVALAALLSRLLRALPAREAAPPRGALLLPVAAGAVLFALHPVQVESVAWVTGRKDVLSGALALAAMLAYFRDGWGRRAAAPGLFVLALLAKPSTVSLPLALAALEHAWLRTPPRRWAARLAPWFVVAGGWVLLTAGSQEIPALLARLAPAWKRPAVAGDALLFYAAKVAWPVGLSPVYGRVPWQVAGIAPWFGFLLFALAAGVLIGRRSRWGACLGVFLAGVLPVLGFLPFLFQIYSTVADRYLYLALPGVSLAAAFGMRLALDLRPRHAPAGWAAVVAVGLALGFASFTQTTHWRDSEALWRRAIAVEPRVAESHNNLGTALAARGREAEAFDHFSEAVRLKPEYEDALSNMANGLITRGRTDEAIAALHRALATKPNFVRAHITLGNALLESGDADSAAASYRRAIEIEPRQLDARYNLAHALLALGDRAGAERSLGEALERNPRFWRATLLLGIIREDEKRPVEAAELYRRTLEAEPGNAEAARRLRKLGQ